MILKKDYLIYQNENSVIIFSSTCFKPILLFFPQWNTIERILSILLVVLFLFTYNEWAGLEISSFKKDTRIP